jgi:hypothetical protein
MVYKLHAIIINKSVSLSKAQKYADDILKKPHKFMRETDDSYRFRNIPKTKFYPSSFRTKVINPYITLIFGQLII